MRSILSAVLIVFLIASTVFAGEPSFRQDNPDIDKYEFAKSFVMALSYYSRVSSRLALEDAVAAQSTSDVKTVHDFIDHRTLDNTELRIARNYLTKYRDSRNALIRKISLEATTAYEKLLTMSVRERDLWQGLEQFKTKKLPQDYNEGEFGREQVRLAMEKKEVAKGIIGQTMLVTKVILSAERCETENCRELALTQDERDKLVKKLDGFAGDNLDWGLKAGQSTLQACVAAFREVLEDSAYRSQP